MKSIQDDPSVIEARATLEGVTGPLSEVEREQDELRSAEVSTSKDDIKAKALRFLSGKGLDERPHVDTRQKRLGELHQKATILKAAMEIASRELSLAEEVASKEILEAAGADLERLGQGLATALTIVSEKAKAFKDMYDGLVEGGVIVGSRYPALALGSVNAEDRYSWVNLRITDLENDYHATVDRKVLESKEAATAKFDEAEVERHRKAGLLIYAGPEGTGRFLKGGKRQPTHLGLHKVPPAQIPSNAAAAR